MFPASVATGSLHRSHACLATANAIAGHAQHQRTVVQIETGSVYFNMASCTRTILICLLTVCHISASLAAIITVPPDLNPGDKYRLVFVSSTTRTATSGDISDYNAFVDTLANSVAELAALDANWRAIASTAAVDAKENIGSSTAPIYRVDGALVAESTDDMWDGALSNPILLTELGTSLTDPAAWTGTLPAGQRHPFLPLGEPSSIVGVTSQHFRKWVLERIAESTEWHSIYAISSEITVQEVPEPASVSMLVIAVGAVLLATRRTQRLDQSPC